MIPMLGRVKSRTWAEGCHRSIWQTGGVEPEIDEVVEPLIGGNVTRARSSSSAVLGAAMKGLGMVIDPDKVDVQIEFAAPSDPEDDLVPLDFGDLPPLT